MKIDRKFNSSKSDYNSEKRCDDAMLSENGHMHIDISINYCFYHIQRTFLLHHALVRNVQASSERNTQNKNGKQQQKSGLKLVKIERMKERLERIRAVVRINKLNIHRNTHTHGFDFYYFMWVCVWNQQHLNHVIEFFSVVCVSVCALISFCDRKKSFNYLLHGWCRCCLIFSLDTHCQSQIP